MPTAPHTRHGTGQQASPAPDGRSLSQIVFRPWDCQVVATAVRFEIPERLASGPRKSAELAVAIGADPATFTRFLDACAILGLVESDGEGTYTLTELGGTLARGSGPFPAMALMNMGEGMWNRMAKLHETILTGRPAKDDRGEDLYQHYDHHPEERLWHAEAMADLSNDAGRALAAGFDFGPYHRIVDIGGSLGILLSHILTGAPHAHGTVFDLPAVVERGRAARADSPVADRLDFFGGSFFEDAPPSADLYLIKQVLCDWGDEDGARILRNSLRNAPSGSRLLVVEWTRPAGGQPDHLDLMSLCLQTVTGGRARTEDEFITLIESVGFRYEKTTPVPSATSPRPWQVLQAVRP
ncbi:methyltransferase [Streptomyces canus]|uniref:O-methyltransferase domain-containing protein n=1 Tax=Streptomyces canus TaxID=58343 RepID=A0AAW8FUG7_9ACTN|nr:methyltransferase [Streptomyces canus]MDQ0758971.1 hypothetical protein [Streptomyces canus]MDQ0912413.1 hypothetical protein [Streptomyces canus]MDQ1072400.1 hypothetical protein [Streptomyces canus]